MSRKRRFGRLRKLPSGRWQARYLGPDSRDHAAPITFATKTEAGRFLALVEAEIARGAWRDPSMAEIPLREYAEAWVGERPNLRPRTVELYRGLLRNHIAPQLGHVLLGQVTPDRVRLWRQRLLEAGVSPTTTAKAYRLLRAVMATAVDDEVILRNPCRIKGASSEPTPERPVATVHQVLDLAERIPGRFRALVLLATFASLRWGELVALQRRHLDLDRGVVRVVASYAELTSGRMLLGPPKSAAGRRTVAIPTVVVPALQRHFDEFAAPGPKGLVFVGVQGAQLRRSNFRTAVRWKETTAAVGLEGLRFHDLRHTGNTLAAATGASTRELMARMGHDSTRAAIIYQHATEDRDRVIADALNALVEEADRARNGHAGLFGGGEASGEDGRNTA